MEITIIIKGATSIEEVRKALGEPNPRVVVTAEELGLHPSTDAPQPEQKETQEEAATKKWHYKRKRTCHKWLTTEEQYIKDLADKGVSVSGIADALYTKFGFRVSPQAVKSRILLLSA